MYRTSKITFKVMWGKADRSLFKQQRKDDLLVLKLAHTVRTLMSDFKPFSN